LTRLRTRGGRSPELETGTREANSRITGLASHFSGDSDSDRHGYADAYAAGSTDAETGSDASAAPDDQADLTLAAAYVNAVKAVSPTRTP
jgi:hypothetical protein